jgi:hypothetical protein
MVDLYSWRKDNNEMNRSIKILRSPNIYFSLIIIAYFAIYIFWYNSKFIDSIEEPTYFGFHGIVNNYYDLFLKNRNFESLNWIVLSFPEMFIDQVLQIFLDPIWIWQAKHIYRLSIVFILFYFSLVKFGLNKTIAFSITVFTFNLQFFAKIHWDSGATYSTIWFLCINIILLHVRKRNIFLALVFFSSIFTLSGYSNPPGMLAAWIGFIICIIIMIYQKNYNNLEIINRSLLFIIGSLPSILIFIYTVYYDTTISNSVNVFLEIPVHTTPFSEIFKLLQGYGYWWTDGGFTNGVPYWPISSVYTSNNLYNLRSIIIFTPIIFCLLMLKRIEKRYSRTLIILSVIVIFVLLLSMNFLQIFDHLRNFNGIFSMYRDPLRKFGIIYMYYLLVIMGLSITIINKSINNKFEIFYSIILIALSLLLFNPESKSIRNFYPNNAREEVKLVSKNINKVTSNFNMDKSYICLRGSGMQDTDFLVKNILKSRFYNRLEGNFANFDLQKCRRKEELTYQSIDLIVLDPEKNVQIEFSDYLSIDVCATIWTSRVLLVNPVCTIVENGTIELPVDPTRLVGPTDFPYFSTVKYNKYFISYV